MAISEDTAALVAAQLTVAWAARTGAPSGIQMQQQSQAVFTRYENFLEQLRKSPGYTLDNL